MAQKYTRTFVLGHYLFLKAQRVRFSEPIMSADKHLSIFLRQMETIVYILFQLRKGMGMEES